MRGQKRENPARTDHELWEVDAARRIRVCDHTTFRRGEKAVMLCSERHQKTEDPLLPPPLPCQRLMPLLVVLAGKGEKHCRFLANAAVILLTDGVEDLVEARPVRADHLHPRPSDVVAVRRDRDRCR